MARLIGVNKANGAWRVRKEYGNSNTFPTQAVNASRVMTLQQGKSFTLTVRLAEPYLTTVAVGFL